MSSSSEEESVLYTAVSSDNSCGDDDRKLAEVGIAEKTDLRREHLEEESVSNSCTYVLTRKKGSISIPDDMLDPVNKYHIPNIASNSVLKLIGEMKNRNSSRRWSIDIPCPLRRDFVDKVKVSRRGGSLDRQRNKCSESSDIPRKAVSKFVKVSTGQASSKAPTDIPITIYYCREPISSNMLTETSGMEGSARSLQISTDISNSSGSSLEGTLTNDQSGSSLESILTSCPSSSNVKGIQPSLSFEQQVSEGKIVQVDDSVTDPRGKDSEEKEKNGHESVSSDNNFLKESHTSPSEEVLITKLETLQIEATDSQGHKPADPIVLSNEADFSQTHQLKWVIWHGKKIPIITQNENGPCPLIAITNILLLRGIIKLPTGMELIAANQLLNYIGERIMESRPKNLSGVAVLNFEQNMQDAIQVLPQLQTGLNVNVKFTGVGHFEYTPECILFDLLNIPLYHGWLVDPQCHQTVQAIGNFGYNQLVERIITNKSSSNPQLVTEALLAEQFLEGSATQLTYHGLCELNAAMKKDELAVLFRNNHFSTILKRKNEIFQLVTDQGFLTEPNVVWETLCNIDGDGQFVDSNFANVPPKATDVTYLPVKNVSEEQQIDHDYLVALSLQEDQKKEQNNEQAWEEFKQTLPGVQDITSELEEDEQRLGCTMPVSTQAIQQTPPLTPQLTGERVKRGVCTVL